MLIKNNKIIDFIFDNAHTIYFKIKKIFVVILLFYEYQVNTIDNKTKFQYIIKRIYLKFTFTNQDQKCRNDKAF